jgi:hypothetical protein
MFNQAFPNQKAPIYRYVMHWDKHLERDRMENTALPYVHMGRLPVRW